MYSGKSSSSKYNFYIKFIQIHRSINVGTLLIINCTPSLKGHNFLIQSIIIDQVLAHFEFIEIKAFLRVKHKLLSI